ncbi:MAG TPA: hypothetical protein VHK69_22100, partial [Chitinophagaceae bacterium]|nr:hypothetical protein [Chitinophagaceae bacterium]
MAYSLLGAGGPGFVFFLSYRGTAIPLQELWFVLSLCALVAGAYFYVRFRLLRKGDQQAGSSRTRLALIEALKRTGDKVIIPPEEAEVRSRTYRQEVMSEGLPSRTEMVDALYDANRNYRTREVRQTYIVFNKRYNGRMYR